MPHAATRPCAQPGCSNLTPGGASYCASHQRVGAAYQGEGRVSAAMRGYDATWRKLRKMVLAQSPLCADPYRIHAKEHQVVAATDVDHIKALKDGGTNNLDNLRSLCHACHSMKTAREDR